MQKRETTLTFRTKELVVPYAVRDTPGPELRHNLDRLVGKLSDSETLLEVFLCNLQSLALVIGTQDIVDGIFTTILLAQHFPRP